MRTEKYTGMSPDWKGLFRSWNEPSTRLLVVAILTIALSATSCRSNKEAVQTSVRLDSLVSVKRTVVRQGTLLPPNQTRLDVPLKAAAELPERAVYTAEDGIVTVTLERKDTTLVITARTDSIVPKLEMKTEENYTWMEMESEREEKPPDKPSFWERFKGEVWELAIGLLLCLVAWKLFVDYVRRE